MLPTCSSLVQEERNVPMSLHIYLQVCAISILSFLYVKYNLSLKIITATCYNGKNLIQNPLPVLCQKQVNSFNSEAGALNDQFHC